jgi:hypothetical protein
MATDHDSKNDDGIKLKPRRIPAQALTSTLKELENAIGRWDQLANAPEAKAEVLSKEQQEFKERTKQLLETLKEQLEAL